MFHICFHEIIRFVYYGQEEVLPFLYNLMDGYSLQLVIKEIDEIYKKDEAICKTDNYAEAINEYNMCLDITVSIDLFSLFKSTFESNSI